MALAASHVYAQAAASPQGDESRSATPDDRAQLAQAPSSQPAAKPGSTQFGIRGGRERLSNGSPAWTDESVEVVHEFDKRKVLAGSIIESSRFGQHDRTVAVEGYYPLSGRATAYLLAATSDTHRVLARSNFHAQLGYTLGDGWGIAAGARRASYNTTSVDVTDLTLERYFSNYRAALTVLPAHSSSAGNATSYRAQFGYYYGDDSRLQLMVSSGTEVDRPTGVNLIVATAVRTTVIYGRHWVAPSWGLDYSIGRTHQGSVVRNAASVGLRFRF